MGFCCPARFATGFADGGPADLPPSLAIAAARLAAFAILRWASSRPPP